MQSGANPSSLAGYSASVDDVISEATHPEQITLVVVLSVVVGVLLWLTVWMYGRHKDQQRKRQEFTRATAEAQKQLDALFDAARGVIGPASRVIIERFDNNLNRLGDQDRGAIAVPQEYHALKTMSTRYQVLMAGRGVVGNSVTLVGDDTPDGGHTLESLELLAKRAAELIPQVRSVSTAGTAIIAACEAIEDAVAHTPQRSRTLAQQRVTLAERVDGLKTQGFNATTLRRKVGSITGQLTQADTAAMHDNFMTARRHLDAAERLIGELTADCDKLLADKRRIDEQIAAFDQLRQEAMGNLKGVQDQLATLAASYSPAALRHLSEGLTQSQQALERARGRMADLRRHVAKGELEAAATLAETIGSAFNAIRELATQAAALPGKLEEDAKAFPARLAEAHSEVYRLQARIRIRGGKQRSYARRAAELPEAIRSAEARARRNPTGALEDLQAVLEEAQNIDTQSDSAATKPAART